MVYFQLIVSGRVQGVAFRHHTKLEADQLGLRGWVKNLEDGTVKIEVSGLEDKVRSFIQWCHEGPRSAEVVKLEYVAIATFEAKGFSIKR